jgi:hypothetical protein
VTVGYNGSLSHRTGIFMHLATPKNSTQLLARLHENERILIRSATVDRLNYLRLNNFVADGPVTIETMLAVKSVLNDDFAKVHNF